MRSPGNKCLSALKIHLPVFQKGRQRRCLGLGRFPILCSIWSWVFQLVVEDFWRSLFFCRTVFIYCVFQVKPQHLSWIQVQIWFSWATQRWTYWCVRNWGDELMDWWHLMEHSKTRVPSIKPPSKKFKHLPCHSSEYFLQVLGLIKTFLGRCETSICALFGFVSHLQTLSWTPLASLSLLWRREHSQRQFGTVLKMFFLDLLWPRWVSGGFCFGCFILCRVVGSACRRYTVPATNTPSMYVYV